MLWYGRWWTDQKVQLDNLIVVVQQSCFHHVVDNIAYAVIYDILLLY